MTKVCFRCSKEKDISEFYVHSGMSDGHLGKCKDCTKEDNTNNRWSKISLVREYDRSRGNRQSYEYIKEYRQKFPEKYNAYIVLSNAVRSGEILKPNVCEECGMFDNRLEAHHKNYDEPLDVEWVCSICHKSMPSF